MQWDKETPQAITVARLKHSAPEVVYAALEAYGAHASANRFIADTNEAMELALEARAHPLIDLGLARNASSTELLQRLYARALAGTGDAEQDLAVRLGCLGNKVAPGMLYSWRTAAVSEDELRRIALEGTFDELKILMQNPSAGGILRDVYGRKSAFEGIPEERWMALVQASTRNPRLNIDE